MGKIIIELDLDPAEIECLEERVRRTKEGLDESLDCTYGIADEIRFIVGKDIEMYDVFDAARNSPEVQEAVKQAVHKEVEKTLTAHEEQICPSSPE